jgi:molybdopterin molybdotransferase
LVQYLPIGYKEALKMTLDHLAPLDPETILLEDSVGRAAAFEMKARVDSPSVDASLKDGFAVQSENLATASEKQPVCLKLIGNVAAGDTGNMVLEPGTAIRVLTGARIPSNADAVLAEEYTRVSGEVVSAFKGAEKGRNILPKGRDVRLGQKIMDRGTVISPGQAGLLAAAGHSQVQVIKNPVVTIIATGDEVVAPGQPLVEGKLYASNLVTLNAWCMRYGMQSKLAVVKDDPKALQNTLAQAVEHTDAVITSGGAWTGDRDLVVGILNQMQWQQVFHRIRIGPGKAAGFGLLERKPIFVLPGGPPSNLIGFLQIALPGLLKLGGHCQTQLPTTLVCLSEKIETRYADWTQFVFGGIEYSDQQAVFHPLLKTSRLQSMAEAQAIVSLPEGVTCLPAGTIVHAQKLT